MQLEDYFDFLAPDDIRIRGTRVGIETVLNQYLRESRSPELIAEAFPSVTLEDVYATILYYLHNVESVGRYFHEWEAYCERAEREHDENPSPGARRLLEIKRQPAASRSAR